MFQKRTSLSATFATLAVVAVVAVPTAQAKTKHQYTSVIRSNGISTGAGYPAVGGTAVVVGTWTTKLFGAGAVVDHVKITGRPDDTTFAFGGTELCYAPKGTIRNVFKGTAVIQPDGSQKLSITGTFTDGTGAYRGATGSFTFTGATAPGSLIVDGRSAGTVTY